MHDWEFNELADRSGLIKIDDERDKQYPVREILRTVSDARERGWRYWWPNGWHGFQGRHPWCVAYAVLHACHDGPETHMDKRPFMLPRDVYCEAQNHDPWEGDCDNHRYDGTSVRAGMKVLRDAGVITEFRWARTVTEIASAIIERGPVVMGTVWYENMMHPTNQGFLEIGGDVYGGHAYVVNGVNLEKRKARCKNSWEGLTDFWVTFDTLEHLLDENGEAAVPVFVE